MRENKLYKIVQKVPFDCPIPDLRRKITTVLEPLEILYSFIVLVKNKNGAPDYIQLEYNVSQNDSFNTLSYKQCVEDIVEIVKSVRKDNQTEVVGYKQPSIDTMLTVYDPLIHKLARQQADKWSMLEYDDLYEMCRFAMFRLYKKNYYIHKRLLEITFINDVTAELRQRLRQPDTVSIDSVAYCDDCNEEITYTDMLPDQDDLDRREQEENKEYFDDLTNTVKKLAIELIGERQFDQLLRDYAGKHTTSWSQKKMMELRREFDRLGITWQVLNNYLLKGG